MVFLPRVVFFFFNDTATTEIYTLSLHDALPISIHIPVLAGGLIELRDPRPGQTAVDGTLGGGGHARLVADRIGPAGTLIGIDRDPDAEERFAELAAEVPCATRFIRAAFVDGLET